MLVFRLWHFQWHLAESVPEYVLRLLWAFCWLITSQPTFNAFPLMNWDGRCSISSRKNAVGLPRHVLRQYGLGDLPNDLHTTFLHKFLPSLAYLVSFSFLIISIIEFFIRYNVVCCSTHFSPFHSFTSEVHQEQPDRTIPRPHSIIHEQLPNGWTRHFNKS